MRVLSNPDSQRELLAEAIDELTARVKGMEALEHAHVAGVTVVD